MGAAQVLQVVVLVAQDCEDNQNSFASNQGFAGVL